MDSLSQFTEVATIQVATGGHDLVLDVLTRDLRSLDHFLAEKLNHVKGIKSILVLPTTSLYLESSRWRLRSLDQGQLTVLTGGTMSLRASNYAIKLDDLDRNLLDRLARDGRLSWRDLAHAANTSTATVRRRVDRLIASGIMTLRCEIANSLAGWPIQVSLLAQVPAKDLDSIGRDIAAWPEARMVAAVAGASNLFSTFWIQELGELQRLEAGMETGMPSLRVTDRMVALGTPKRAGHLCNAEGRRIGVTPISPW